MCGFLQRLSQFPQMKSSHSHLHSVYRESCLRTTAASFRDNEASISERVLLSYAARRVILPAGTGLGTPAAVKVVRTTSFWNAGSSAMSGCMIMSGAAMSRGMRNQTRSFDLARP